MDINIVRVGYVFTRSSISDLNPLNAGSDYIQFYIFFY